MSLVVLGLLGTAALWGLWRYRRGTRWAGVVPTPLPVTQVPGLADRFDFPLDPTRFGPYLPYISSPFAIDTRFGVQNPGVGQEGKCFVDRQGKAVPFAQLYHAGEDWFGLNSNGQIQGRAAAGEPVRAVANGVVTWIQALGNAGYVLIIEHTTLTDTVWSVYWHIADIQVAQGEAVTLGQPLARVHDQGFNSHLHWEIRTFADAQEIFPDDSAGGRGRCNGYVAGVGYTWDDDPERAKPEAWGYLHPSEFVTAHQE
ncbi:MAG: M23 family metallopeptidase [Anaerolineae bacterium]|nr:M23 family metallopeptidase [Anaerolineae bacterium]